eukprot:193236-Amphidinium_carterae.1
MMILLLHPLYIQNPLVPRPSMGEYLQRQWCTCQDKVLSDFTEVEVLSRQLALDTKDAPLHEQALQGPGHLADLWVC